MHGDNVGIIAHRVCAFEKKRGRNGEEKEKGKGKKKDRRRNEGDEYIII